MLKHHLNMNKKLATFLEFNTHRPFFPISTAKQPSPKPIPSPPFHISNNYSTFRRISRFGIEDIKNLDDALKLFDEMLKTKPPASVFDYNNLFNIVVRMRCYSHVVVMFRRLSLFRGPVNDYTMNIVMNCYCSLRESDLGFAVLGVFVKRGFGSDIVVSVNCLMKGLFFEEKAGKALELFERLNGDDLCEPSNTTFSIVLDGLCKSGDTSKAVKLLKDLEKRNYELNVVVYNTVVDSLCKNGMVGDALTVVSKMIVRRVQPDIVIFNALIHGLCIERSWDEANKLLQRMVNCKIYPNIRTFNMLVYASSKEGFLKYAEDWIKVMTKCGVKPNVYTYNALMDGYSLQGQPNKAKEVFYLMVNKGVNPDLVSYGIIINGYCKQKNIDLAWKMFEEMPQKGLKPDAVVYNTMIKGLFSVGRCSDAQKLYDEMKRCSLLSI